MPVRGVELDHELVRVRALGLLEAEAQAWRLLEDEPQLRLQHGQVLTRADEERDSRPAPVVDLEPYGRVGLRGRVVGHSVDRPVALVLSAHVLLRVGLGHGPVDGHQGILQDRRVPRGEGLHGGRAHHLHQVVHHHVAHGSHGIVEMAPVLHAEVLRHRDLHRRQVVAVPQRLEDRVREAQVEDLPQAHLPEEVVDPVELGLVDVLVHLLGERPGGGEVVAEGLLDHHARVLGQARIRQALDDHAEQRRWDLEVEDGAACPADLLREPLERGRIAKVAAEVRQPRGEAIEHLVVDRLAAVHDRLAGVIAEVVDGPVVAGHAHDRAAQQARAARGGTASGRSSPSPGRR